MCTPTRFTDPRCVRFGFAFAQCESPRTHCHPAGKTPGNRSIFSHWPHIKVLILLRAGAIGVLLETDSRILLPEAIHTIQQGKTWVSPKAQPLDSSDGNGHVEIWFTANERELISWLAKGMNSQEIADQLGKGERNVRDYECGLKWKLGFDNCTKLVAWASPQLASEVNLEQSLTN
jgi:DNA-binding NarL/FixJ family response regulator